MGGDFRAELREFIGVVPVALAQDLVGGLTTTVRIKNATRLGKVYQQLSSALIRRRPSLAPVLAANRGAIVRQLACSIQFGSALGQLLDRWSPSCVISTSDFWPLEHQLCRQASQRKIPSILIQHGAIGDFWWPFVADMYCMWGETHVQQMQELGAPLERMVAAGMPATDSMFRGTEDGSRRRPSDRSRPICLLISHTHGRAIEKDIFDKYRHFVSETIQLAPEINWMVKLHPMENDELYREMGSSVFDRLTFYPKTASLQDAVTDADVVTTVYSTAGLESMVLGRPLIIAPAIARVRHLAPWPSMGGGMYANTPADFQFQLNRLISDQDYREQQLRKQERFLAKSFANQGHAAERIVDWLAEYSAPRAVPVVPQRCSSQTPAYSAASQ